VSRRGLVSPRSGGARVPDLGERSAFIGGQRIGHGGRAGRRAGGLRRLAQRVAMAIAALLALGAHVTLVHWALTAPRFAVGAVEVRGAWRVPAERIVEAAGIPAGINFWRLDPDAVAARVEALPEIRRVDVVRELPNRVTIVVEERRPFTLVHGERLHWLDEEGRVLGVEPSAVALPVPVISGLTEEELATIRSAPSPRVRAAVRLIRALLRSGSALATEISEIDMSRRDGPVLYTVDGIEVRLGAEEWEERLARLEGVLAQVAAGDGAVRAIDLRFRDQVVLRRGGQG
jgi:cell division septal protein FtsQ